MRAAFDRQREKLLTEAGISSLASNLYLIQMESIILEAVEHAPILELLKHKQEHEIILMKVWSLIKLIGGEMEEKVTHYGHLIIFQAYAYKNPEVTLDFEQDTLALYTPPIIQTSSWTSNRFPHTRSVLVCRRPANDDLMLLDQLSFVLVISAPKSLSLEKLLRFMLLSYCRRAYSDESEHRDFVKHGPLYDILNTPQPQSDLLPPCVPTQTIRRLDKIDGQNGDEFEYCLKNQVFNADKWEWHVTGSREIKNDIFRELSNINFIRDVKTLAHHRQFKEETQYKLIFDNHLIVYYFLQRFRYEVEVERGEPRHRIKVLDPIASSVKNGQHALYEGGNPVFYIEKQLNRDTNLEFCHALRFEGVEKSTGGLLHPAHYNDKDNIFLYEPNTLDVMASRSLVDDPSRERLTRAQKEVAATFKIRYNRFFIDLSQYQLYHLPFPTRKKLLSQAIEKKQKLKPMPIVDVVENTNVKRVKNQPTLAQVFEYKRKREEEAEEKEREEKKIKSV
jgi:hypothetical protein